MAINFPNSPTLNEEFQSGNTTWKWNGTVWLKIAETDIPEVELRTSNPYTLILSDAEKYLRFSDTSQFDVTVPAESTSNFTTGSIITIEQRNTGRVKVLPASGVTLNYYGGQYTAGQYAIVQIIKVGTDTWTLIGGTAL